MRFLLFILFAGFASLSSAQHCPWDCAGFLMVKTDASRQEMSKLHPVLVDKNKMPIIDTMYGTGAETYDSCVFMFYSDFKKYRIDRIKLHHWYAFDTMLNFAASHYVVHYNYCKYRWDEADALFIRVNDTSKKNSYTYIEIPRDKRIHLHDFNTQIRIDDYSDKQMLKEVEPFIFEIPKNKWGSN